MSDFSRAIESYWHQSFHTGDLLFRSDALTVTANPDLRASRRLMLLQTSDDKVEAVLTPALADKLDLSHDQQDLTVALLRQKLHDAQVKLHGADNLFYFPESALQALHRELPPDNVRAASRGRRGGVRRVPVERIAAGPGRRLRRARPLGGVRRLRAGTSGLRRQHVSLGRRKIADVGVLTLPPFRGNGHARGVIRAISGHAVAQAHEPQYRCQLDNAASVALAKSSGLSLFGTWDVISSESVD